MKKVMNGYKLKKKVCFSNNFIFVKDKEVLKKYRSVDEI